MWFYKQILSTMNSPIRMNFEKPLPIFHKIKTLHFLFIYFIFLILIAPFQLRGADSYYYWDWSRHLDLSYFDGPPMIAYWIRGATLLFHDTLFALASPMIVSAGLSTWLLYKTARTFLSQEASLEAMLFWLFSPLTTLDLLTQTTYDSPQTLFWIGSLYFCMRFIKEKSVKDLYFIGTFIGLLLISKYTGAILVLGLVLFLAINPRYRYLFKNLHFYAAMGLSLLITSPVIIWGVQHQWISFGYQLTNHISDSNTPTLWIFFKYSFVYLNMMVVPFLISFKCKTLQPISNNARDSVKLCVYMCSTIWLFFLLCAFKVKIHYTWLEPFLITTALLVPFWQHPFKKVLLIVNIIISLLILLNGTFLFKKPSYYDALQTIQHLNDTHPELPSTVVTDHWLEARQLFFIKNKPKIYTLGCDHNSQNQYLLWSQNLNKTLKEAKEFLYISHGESTVCLQKYSSECSRWPLNGLVVYRCLS